MVLDHSSVQQLETAEVTLPELKRLSTMSFNRFGPILTPDHHDRADSSAFTGNIKRSVVYEFSGVSNFGYYSCSAIASSRLEVVSALPYHEDLTL